MMEEVKREKTTNSLLETIKGTIMNFELLKSDIRRIGDSAYHNDDGYCVIVFYDDDAAYQVAYILLRNILRLFGQQYQITSEDEYPNDRGELAIHLTTNLPWAMYKSEDETMTS